MISNFKQYMVPVPKMEIPTKRITDVILLKKPERYVNDIKNEHHWTTNYVWNNVIPILAKDFKLKINESDFDLIKWNTKLGDFSYHSYKEKQNFTFVDLENNKTINGDNNILRVKPNEPMWSDYHRLYRGAHRVSYIVNNNCKNERILLINGDSMTVPIIPILANYFKKIICLDNRSKFDKKYPNLVNWDEITDYLCMFTTLGWIEKKLPQLYLHPYIK